MVNTCPAQMLPLLTATTGNGFTVTILVAVLLQPLLLVPVTVYVAVTVGENATPLVTPPVQV